MVVCPLSRGVLAQSIPSVSAPFAIYVLAFAAAAVACFASVPRARTFDDPDVRVGLVSLLVLSGLWATAHVGFLLAGQGSLAVPLYVAGLVAGFSTIGAWLYFCSAYTGRTLHRQPVYRRAAVGVFLAVLAVKFTNPIHGIYFTVEPSTTPFPHLGIHHLVGHWIAMGLAYALATVGIFMLVEQFTQVGADTTPLAVLVGITGLPLVLDVIGTLHPGLIDMTYEPLGVAVFAVGVLFVFYDRFQATRIAHETDEPVIVLDDDDRVRDYNVSARRCFPEIADRVVIGEPLAEALPELAAAVESGTDVCPVDRDGETRYYRVSVGPFTAGSRHLGRLLTIADVTDRERYRTELERQNERLDRFASVVSHDLRNPLNVAQGRVELALETGDDEHLAAAANALDRMEELIADVLTLARQGQPIGETERVRLEAVAEAAWSVIEADAATLAVADDPAFRADADRLKQLLENLFRNAIEHGGSDVRVTVGALPDGTGFYVADDGPGIPEESREEVFEYGYTTNRDGTGFGLAIVSEIAEAHGWDVTATEGATGGARFEFAGVDPAGDDAESGFTVDDAESGFAGDDDDGSTVRPR
ncbi:sensor histidine kinase [Halopenitus persicus]|uniref:histidine kinase n=1 Tax=Halopenitus persicus TaxID=1048396 RepID=A0A1H3GVI4_9EURY|nr:sensor histidine kinase [Halopenitus persicus]SDY06995.1 Signal transduction histidine kinase [Halopenitus persicus]